MKLPENVICSKERQKEEKSIMIQLISSRLRVEISEPGECPNDTVRFDRAGYVSEVVLDGAHHFCASEPHNLIHPSSGGRGLCCEYTADYSKEAEEGEYYPKLGVGLIRKRGPYCFFGKYEVHPFETDCMWNHDKAVFVTHPECCLGYAMRTTKTISIKDDTLTMETEAENCGEKEIDTEEYCHNFISIDGMAVTPDYRLDFPVNDSWQTGDLENQYPTPCNFFADKGGVSLKRAEPLVSLSSVPLDGMNGASPFQWTLRHAGSGFAVEITDKIKVNGITLWAADHIISAEIFHNIRLRPGEKYGWSRTWRFINEKM